MTKIVQLTTVHTALDVRIFHKEARALSEAGFDVVIIAPHPTDEVRYGIRILALDARGNRIHRMTVSTWRAYKAARTERADVYHFHDPELLPVGLLLKLSGRRVVYDVHEDVPRDIMVKEWVPRLLRKPLSLLAELLEAMSAACFDGVVAATPKIASRFPAHRTVVVRNYPRPEEIDSETPECYEQRPPYALYVGAMHPKRGLFEMVDAMAKIDDRHNMRLRLGGVVSPADLERLETREGATSVDLLGWCSRDEVMRELSQARVGLVILHPLPTYVESLPIKLFEYMSAGIPVIASDFPSWRAIVAEANCGILVNPEDTTAIAQALEWILNNPTAAREMGERGRVAARSRFTWASEARTLCALHERLV